MKTLLFSAAALLLACTALAAIESRTGVWTAELDGERLHLSLFTSSKRSSLSVEGGGNQTGFTLPVSRLEGFAPAAQTKFAFRAPAGTIELDGHFSGGQGAGHFRFTPSETFVRELGSLGYSDLEDHELLVYATAELAPSMLRELRAMGYDISRRELDEVAVFHITPQTVRDYAAAGYPKLTLRELVDLRAGKVDGPCIQAMRELGYGGLSARELADTAILGVTPSWIRELRSAGLHDLSASELRELRVGRINAAAIEAYRRAGYPDLTAHQLSEFGIHHVTPEYIAQLKSAIYDHLTPSELVEMRIFRITPDFVAQMNALGVKDLKKMIELRATGAADVLLNKRQK